MSAIDRLLDMVSRDSLWWTPPAPITTLTKVDTTEEMRILPDTPHGPMLEVAQKNSQGVEMVVLRYSLAAVDQLIGKLITMRDHMANIKGDGAGPMNVSDPNSTWRVNQRDMKQCCYQSLLYDMNARKDEGRPLIGDGQRLKCGNCGSEMICETGDSGRLRWGMKKGEL